jgi:hypothetical protein
MRFTVPFEEVATGAVANTYKTIAAIRAADTAGYRFRLRRLQLGNSEDTPQDLAVGIALKRVDDVSAGGAGTSTAVTPLQVDSLSRAAVCTAGKNYTVEPTTYGNPLWEMELNCRNSLDIVWTEEEAPVVNRDQLLGLLICPRTAVARTFSGCLEFEEF